MPAPSPAHERERIAQLAAGEEADKQAVADFKLRSGGEAAVRLDELEKLRALPKRSLAEDKRLAELAKGEAVDKQAVANVHLSRGGGKAAVRLWPPHL